MEPAIKATGLAKDYRIYPSPLSMVKEALNPFGKRYHRAHAVLKGVSLELGRRESLAVLGRNGSGKSTLLQLLCGILQPTVGSVEVRGRIAALLQLGAGFHPDFTGRENVYMNGAVLGLEKQEMDERFGDIAAFADIGEHIDRPVKHYSSGMLMRLAFAAATHVNPEILVIDEILAVGDFAFRQKCVERINAIRRKAAVLLVSHNLRDVLLLCSRAIVLDKGEVAFQGPAQEAVDFYLRMLEADEPNRGKDNPSAYGELLGNEEKIADVSHRWADRSGASVETVGNGEALALEFSFRLLQPAPKLLLGLPIWGPDDNLMTALNTDADAIEVRPGPDGWVRGRVVMDRVPFNPGTYHSALAIQDGKEFLYRGLLDPFKVRKMPVCYGVVTPEHRWEIEDAGHDGRGKG